MSKSISEMFIKEAIRTEAPITPELVNRLTEERTIRLLHASIGMVTEAGELLDALKKFIFYGKDLDLVNIKEELGDSNWYQALALDEIGNSYEEIWAMVIKKLQARHGNQYNAERVINRDLDNERRVMEDALNSNLHELTESVVERVKTEISEELNNAKLIEIVKEELQKEEYDRVQNESALDYGTRVNKQLENILKQKIDNGTQNKS